MSNDTSDGMSAAYLLTALGLSNTFGRVLSGLLGTKKWVDSLVVNSLALLIAGAVTMLLPYAHSYFLLTLFAVVFGLCVGEYQPHSVMMII